MLLGIAVGEVDVLLHLHGARQSGRSGGKDDHKPITEVLHLGTATRCNHSTQDCEMGTAQLVGRLRCQPGGQLGGADEVREKNRDVLCGSHRTPCPRH